MLQRRIQHWVSDRGPPPTPVMMITSDHYATRWIVHFVMLWKFLLCTNYSVMLPFLWCFTFCCTQCCVVHLPGPLCFAICFFVVFPVVLCTLPCTKLVNHQGGVLPPNPLKKKCLGDTVLCLLLGGAWRCVVFQVVLAGLFGCVHAPGSPTISWFWFRKAIYLFLITWFFFVGQREDPVQLWGKIAGTKLKTSPD